VPGEREMDGLLVVWAPDESSTRYLHVRTEYLQPFDTQLFVVQEP
jgi:hypothetical protein